MRRLCVIAIILCVAACSTSGPVFTQVTAWTPAQTSVDVSIVRALLVADTSTDPIKPLPGADANIITIGELTEPDLIFVQVTASPGTSGVNPRECMLVLAASKLADRYCDADGEFLPHASTAGFLALPTDSTVTFVRLSVCDTRLWEKPVHGFVVFPLTAQQATAGWAAEVFRGAHPKAVAGSAPALTAHRCIAAA